MVNVSFPAADHQNMCGYTENTIMEIFTSDTLPTVIKLLYMIEQMHFCNGLLMRYDTINYTVLDGYCISSNIIPLRNI